MAALPQQGSLAEHPLPRLLVDLYRERFNGALTLTRGRTKKRFLFQNGAPLKVESNMAAESLSTQLSDAGAIDANQRNEIEKLVKSKGVQEGVAVLSLKLLDAKALFVALKEQLRRRAVECFGWPDGEFALDGAVAPPGDAQAFRTDPYALIQDGLAAHWSVDRLMEGLMGQLGQYPKPTPVLPEITRRLRDDPAVESFVQGLDGLRTLGQSLGKGGNLPQVLAALWLMDASDALRYHDEPIRGAGEVAEAPEIEIEVAGAQAGRAPNRPGAGSEAPGESAGVDPKTDQMRVEVLEKHAQLSELSYYELLAVENDCKPAAIKKAYFSSAKRYHPDALNRLKLGDIKVEAGAVFSEIAKAYEVLSDAKRRKEYDASLLGDNREIDANRLTQAETFYRKGEILARMGDFRSALQFFQNAVNVWPEEPVYQCDLGWTFFRKYPVEQGPAQMHLELAIGMQDDFALAHFRLGLVLKDLGEEKSGEEHIARAKQLDPTVS